jgi:peptidyl-prolyl cis-trans isomerase SurA
MMRFGLIRKGAGALALSFLAVAAAAQTGASRGATQPSGPAPAQAQAQPQAQQPAGDPALNIPSDVSFVGPTAQPNVARATAIVNDDIITRSDIDHRLALFLGSQPNAQVSPEEMQILQAQVLRNLIDETLQIQAARERDIEIEQRDVDRYYAQYARGFGHTPQTFAQYLASIGSSDRSAKRQILGELSWRELQRRLPQVSISDEEVNRRLNSLITSRGAPEYQVAEIFMYASPENAAQVRQRMGQIIQQIRAGANFAAYARQFSEATSAAVGGNLGWLRLEQLPQEIGTVLQQMPVGAISDPIQLPDGFSVVLLRDSRQVLVANPRDAVLSLMQMSINLPAGTSEAVARQRAEELSRTASTMGGCGGAQAAATRIGAELVAADGRRVRELPPVLQEPLLQLSVGQATTVFGSTERISILVLCGRDDPQAAAEPTFQNVADRVEEERMGRQAQRLLRDLRRDAVIEYR